LDNFADTSEIGDWKMPDFGVARSYAASQGWLIVQDDALTLTTAGAGDWVGLVHLIESDWCEQVASRKSTQGDGHAASEESIPGQGSGYHHTQASGRPIIGQAWPAEEAAEAILGDLVTLTTRHPKKGAKIRLNGIGILQVRKRAARMGRNPAIGEAIKIKASKKVAFRVAKELKEAV
jgi:DNA-binding protein HU-beta